MRDLKDHIALCLFSHGLYSIQPSPRVRWKPQQITRLIMNLKTVKQFCKSNPAFTNGGVRWQIFNEHTNGLAESGAVSRMGRKILIDEDKYLEWATSGQAGTGMDAKTEAA